MILKKFLLAVLYFYDFPGGQDFILRARWERAGYDRVARRLWTQGSLILSRRYSAVGPGILTYFWVSIPGIRRATYRPPHRGRHPHYT